MGIMDAAAPQRYLLKYMHIQLQATQQISGVQEVQSNLKINLALQEARLQQFPGLLMARDPLEGYNVNWTFNETGQHTVEQTATSAFGCSTTEEDDHYTYRLFIR